MANHDVKIKNTSGVIDTWVGQTFAIDEIILIEPVRLVRYNNAAVITSITAGDLSVIKTESPDTYYTVNQALRIIQGLPTDIVAGSASDGEVLRMDAGTDEIEWVVGDGVSFGTEFGATSSDVISSTTADTEQVKVSHTTSSLISGYTYRIGYTYTCRSDSQASTACVTVYIDDVNQHTGCYKPSSGNTDNYITYSGFYYTNTLSGPIDIEIRYFRDGNNGSTYIKDARVEIWRVS